MYNSYIYVLSYCIIFRDKLRSIHVKKYILQIFPYIFYNSNSFRILLKRSFGHYFLRINIIFCIGFWCLLLTFLCLSPSPEINSRTQTYTVHNLQLQSNVPFQYIFIIYIYIFRQLIDILRTNSTSIELHINIHICMYVCIYRIKINKMIL